MTDYKQIFDSFQEDFGLLIEAGFVAIQQLNEDDARKLFSAAKLLRPESVVPEIGMGYIHLNKMEQKEAMAIFEKVVVKEPDNCLAQMLYGVSMMMSKNTQNKGEALVNNMMTKTDDPTVLNFGKTALQWSDKDLKGSKAPFFEGATTTTS